jgi:hypothetical protein
MAGPATALLIQPKAAGVQALAAFFMARAPANEAAGAK